MIGWTIYIYLLNINILENDKIKNSFLNQKNKGKTPLINKDGIFSLSFSFDLIFLNRVKIEFQREQTKPYLKQLE